MRRKATGLIAERMVCECRVSGILDDGLANLAPRPAVQIVRGPDTDDVSALRRKEWVHDDEPTRGHCTAGFYPAENGRVRYWDGDEWTSLYRDSPSDARNLSANGVPMAGVPSVGHIDRPRGRRGACLTSPPRIVLATGRYAAKRGWGPVDATRRRGGECASRSADHRAGVGDPGTLRQQLQPRWLGSGAGSPVTRY